MVTNTCLCAVCVRSRKLQDLARRAGNTPDDLKLLDEVESDLAHAETDAVYWRMKYTGEWDALSSD